MARLDGFEGGIINQILPQIGERRLDTPIWDESRQMFITDQYPSAAGNRYYLGVRIADRFMTILHIGHYHSWTYINEVELYVFDGNGKVLVGKDKLDVFYDEKLIRNTTENLLKNYLVSQIKICGSQINNEILDSEVKSLVDRSYCSLINDASVVKRFREIAPQLKINKICS